MLLDVARSALAPEVAALRRARRRAALTGLALVAFALGLGFALLGLFLGLSQIWDGWIAALVVAGAGLTIGLFILLMARLTRRSDRDRRPVPRAQPLASDLGRNKPDTAASISAVSAALAAGIFLGRNLPK